jgi:hypothetical protein
MWLRSRAAAPLPEGGSEAPGEGPGEGPACLPLQLSVSLAAQNPASFNEPETPSMWKLIVGFAAFAALALFILTKSGGDIDLSGESHGISVPHEPAASEAPAASAASQPAIAAVEAASAASQ